MFLSFSLSLYLFHFLSLYLSVSLSHTHTFFSLLSTGFTESKRSRVLPTRFRSQPERIPAQPRQHARLHFIISITQRTRTTSTSEKCHSHCQRNLCAHFPSRLDNINNFYSPKHGPFLLL